MKHDCAVIGGGPAGATAAIQLARAGEHVCLLERTTGAHDKVCGEFISWEAAQYLEELGLDLAELGALRISRMSVFNEDRHKTAELPFPAWSLSRRRLDDALIDRAERAGARVERGVTVKKLSQVDNGWALTTTARNGGASRLQAETVFLASGKHDLRNLRRERRDQPDLIGLKMHLRLNEEQEQQLRQTVEIYVYEGGYAGLELVEEGKANLCFLIKKEIYTRRCHGEWSEVLAWLGNRSAFLRSRLAGADSLWPKPLAVYGTPYGYLHEPGSQQPGLFRLGDQMAVIPSFAGDGIAIAMHSAMLATGLYASGGDAKDYHLTARESFRRPVRNAQLLAGFMSKRTGRQLLLGALTIPGLMEKAINSTRLGDWR